MYMCVCVHRDICVTEMHHFRLYQFSYVLSFREWLTFCVLFILIQVLSHIPHFLFNVPGLFGPLGHYI